MPGGTPGKFPKRYADYPGGVEFYDVLSPAMTTYYSQVWWSPLAPSKLPKEMVDKYAGKSVAIVGWEIDQVRVMPDGTEKSVPINACYNHHYNAQMIGGKTTFEEVNLTGPDDPRAASILAHSHGHINYDATHYVATGGSSTFMASGNGGEYRKTYHGYAPGYAIVVDSPTELQVSPMQIDTWNRDEMDIDAVMPPPFVAGPLPSAAEAPEGAMYSGLLECPMTTRITKVVDGDYALASGGSTNTCTNVSVGILTFQECYHAAATTVGSEGQTFLNSTGSDPKRPRGCTVTTDPAQPLEVYTFFNLFKNSTVMCGGASASSSTLRGAAAPGSLGVTVDVALDAAASTATLILTGPAAVWYGVGFAAQAMLDRPWTIIIDGGATGAVTERKLGGPSGNPHIAGDLLPASLTVQSSTLSKDGKTRVVVLTRPLLGKTSDYYTFNATAVNPEVKFIAAIGTGPTLGYHAAKEPSTLTLLPVGATAAGACVCPTKSPVFGYGDGKLVYTHGNQSIDIGTGAVAFKKPGHSCKPAPEGCLLDQKNPTCDVRYYRGGQWACHHKWSLLDADQEIPWVDKPLVFHHKWRIWVQPYNASYHTPLHYGHDTDLVIGSPYEYDVPKCAEKPTPAGCAFEKDTQTWVHTITGRRIGAHNFAGLTFHCHAPTCLSMAVYQCPTDMEIGDCNTTTGELLCLQEPVYGGSYAPQLNGTRFDEPGYIAIPDCYWGDEEFGLTPPPNVTGHPLFMLKRANATWAHYGEMAGGQPWVY